jgi:hypothetical protein
MGKFILGIVLLLFPYNVSAKDAYDHLKERFYTAARDECIVTGKPSAVEIGNALAHGTAVGKNFAHVLSSQQFDDIYYPSPVDLAYGFYLIAQRIGTPNTKRQIDWLHPYVNPQSLEIVQTIIFRKYSNSYLRKCFSVNTPPRQVQQPYSGATLEKDLDHIFIMTAD